jgi:hypothetical protein
MAQAVFGETGGGGHLGPAQRHQGHRTEHGRFARLIGGRGDVRLAHGVAASCGIDPVAV